MNYFQKVFNAIFNRPTPKASSGVGYDAGSSGRRAQGWQASRLGPNTLLWSNLEQLRARSRDAVRNSAIARSAVDKWESNIIGAGIVPHFLHSNPDTRTKIQEAWGKWVKSADYAGQLNFYGQQALVARELFEAGECFVRFHVGDDSMQLQLIESEQLPIFRNSFSTSEDRTLKSGIVFDANDKRVGYEMYKGQPYDSMFDPMGATQFVFIPAEDMLHIMKPLRAGQLRGEPQMTAVLTLLFEIDGYSDAERVRKKVGSMWAAFVTKLNPDDSIIPVDTDNAAFADAGTEIGKMEPGTIQSLLPGEDIKFPQLPEASDFAAFMNQQLHTFAAGVGLTYEQLTGDLRGVNYSSIRAGVLEFRRAAEQYQANIIINGFCEPVLKRWMKEAVLSGALELPDDYFEDSTQYENCVWVAPGWSWVDPAKEMAAYQQAVRSGFTSRTMVVRETGYDPEVIDAQSVEERKRAKELGLVYDSDPNQVLIGRETVPVNPTDVTPDSDTEEDSEE